jgi:hypothetical protein
MIPLSLFTEHKHVLFCSYACLKAVKNNTTETYARVSTAMVTIATKISPVQ